MPRKVRVRATMSSTVLDLREARLPAGAVEIDLRAIMSSIEILVPPGLAVETEGMAIMGTFEHVDRAPAHPDPDAPLLRACAASRLMGSVEIKMRMPGEMERDAHRRLKQGSGASARRCRVGDRVRPRHRGRYPGRGRRRSPKT